MLPIIPASSLRHCVYAVRQIFTAEENSLWNRGAQVEGRWDEVVIRRLRDNKNSTLYAMVGCLSRKKINFFWRRLEPCAHPKLGVGITRFITGAHPGSPHCHPKLTL